MFDRAVKSCSVDHVCDTDACRQGSTVYKPDKGRAYSHRQAVGAITPCMCIHSDTQRDANKIAREAF